MPKEKVFKGFHIPPQVDTPKGREFVRQGYRGKGGMCFFLPEVEADCDTWLCDSCIACDNCGDASAKRKAFEEYDRLYPIKSNDAMPELKPGMVVCLRRPSTFDRYALLVHERKNGAYIGYQVEGVGDTLIRLADPCEVSPDDKDVFAVYRDDYWGHFNLEQMSKLLRGCKSYLIWKRPDPVKEMTVDEISKALGYKVKVVGSEKADD